jgi:hypothetical protein
MLVCWPGSNFFRKVLTMPLFGKAAPATKSKTMVDHLEDFEKAIDNAIAEARRGHVDARRLARVLRERADMVHHQWAITAPIM